MKVKKIDSGELKASRPIPGQNNIESCTRMRHAACAESSLEIESAENSSSLGRPISQYNSLQLILI